MKTDRLLGMTVYLLNHGKTNAKSLSQKFSVSVRTVQRDIDCLCAAGIPICSTYGANGGYEILDSFRMTRQVAGQQDYSFIMTALKGLATAFDDPGIRTTLEKITATSPFINLESGFLLDFGTLRENEEVVRRLKILNEAIRKKRVVRFNYANASGGASIPEVEPIALAYKWYSWYLLGYSSDRKDYRLYKVIRMDQVHLTELPVVHRHPSANRILNRHDQNDGRKYIDIRIRCKSEVRTRAIEYLNGIVEKELENGDFIMKLHLPENEQLWFGTLLSLGKLVQVIEPAFLKERLRRCCKEILNLYEHL
ncbi:WYL domain-containing protein [Sporolactobacillus sp. CQH2019]|uniref:helix-turn-helix transcriptional regulator n=1 Tax=Sporolactobacillus sp. CQH2019 TaxID=3023512 RepID=UPI002368E65E|nr:WYL domain-containing protein [Sporolactobacillus sp. CQH2019]MDD9150573.1 WYL domain-containing protein [Sporolactobacillus sp. CQH2019]